MIPELMDNILAMNNTVSKTGLKVLRKAVYLNDRNPSNEISKRLDLIVEQIPLKDLVFLNDIKLIKSLRKVSSIESNCLKLDTFLALCDFTQGIYDPLIRLMVKNKGHSLFEDTTDVIKSRDNTTVSILNILALEKLQIEGMPKTTNSIEEELRPNLMVEEGIRSSENLILIKKAISRYNLSDIK